MGWVLRQRKEKLGKKWKDISKMSPSKKAEARQLNALQQKCLGSWQVVERQKKEVIQDRTIYEDAHIFAPNLHSMGLMSSRDYENYKSLCLDDLKYRWYQQKV